MIKYEDCLKVMDQDSTWTNPFLSQIDTYSRRQRHAAMFAAIDQRIQRQFYPHFISYPEEAELIEALIRSTQAKKILEVGCFTGFTTLHMIRAIYPDGLVVGVDRQKVMPEFFNQFQQCFRFHQGETPEVFERERGTIFDFVYVDSDHSPDHTRKEIAALMQFTKPGSMFVFHDCAPKLRSENDYGSNPIWKLLYEHVAKGIFTGGIFPSVDRLDVMNQAGDKYDRNCLPHVGIFRRI